MKHLHSFQSSAVSTEGWDAQAEVSWGWWQQCRVMGMLCATPAWQHSSPPSASDQKSPEPWCCGAAASGTVQRHCCLPCAPLTPWLCTQAFIARAAHGTQVSVQPVLHGVPSSGVAALERALDHNPAWPPSSITTNLFLHPVPTYQICSHPINQPSPVSCMEGWYLRSLLHHSALRHNYTPLKCTQHLLHHERCTKNMIREG